MRLLFSRLSPIIHYYPRRGISRFYSKKHEWLSLIKDNKVGRVGISDYAQEALGDVVHVQVPEVGQKFKQFDEVGAIESVKAASELLTPVSGEIVAINEKLDEKPGLVNSKCYDDGWLFEIKIENDNELDALMDQEAYDKYLKEDNAD